MLKTIFYDFIQMIQDMWNTNDDDVSYVLGARILACIFVLMTTLILFLVGLLLICLCTHVKAMLYIVVSIGLFSLLMKGILSIKPPTPPTPTTPEYDCTEDDFINTSGYGSKHTTKRKHVSPNDISKKKTKKSK